MGYCPKCGSKIYSEELFCVSCGEKLPENIEDRFYQKKWQLKHFFIPIITFLLVLIVSIGIVTYERIQVNNAKELYNQAEEALFHADYEKADQHVREAIETHPTFSDARTLAKFTKFTVDTMKQLDAMETNQDQLQLILKAKNQLKQYSGEIADQFHNQLLNRQKGIQLMMINDRLDKKPSIDELPVLLWEADSINDPEAYTLARNIRDLLITESTNLAYQFVEQNQFSMAQNMIENALYYLPEDEKLTSLLNSIDKEKSAFELAEEARLEQAFSQYEAEQKINEHEAIEDISIDFEINNSEQLIIAGEITSVATVPIHAIIVNYIILDEDKNELLSNEIYVYPETLYPGETGKFDHTHLDEELTENVSSVHVASITWLLD